MDFSDFGNAVDFEALGASTSTASEWRASDDLEGRNRTGASTFTRLAGGFGAGSGSGRARLLSWI